MTLVTYAKRVGDSIEMVNKHQITEFLNEKGNKNYKGEYVVEIKRAKKRRTLPQNNALHKFFELLAKAFNEKGLTMQMVLSKIIDLDWNTYTVKEVIWKPLQKALTGKEHTSDLDNISEIDMTYEHLNKYLGQQFHIHIPFPTKQNPEFEIESIYEELEKPNEKPKF